MLDIISVETAAAAYEASLIPVGSVADVRSITGDAMVSWATASILAILAPSQTHGDTLEVDPPLCPGHSILAGL